MNVYSDVLQFVYELELSLAYAKCGDREEEVIPNYNKLVFVAKEREVKKGGGKKHMVLRYIKLEIQFIQKSNIS